MISPETGFGNEPPIVENLDETRDGKDRLSADKRAAIVEQFGPEGGYWLNELDNTRAMLDRVTELHKTDYILNSPDFLAAFKLFTEAREKLRERLLGELVNDDKAAVNKMRQDLLGTGGEVRNLLKQFDAGQEFFPDNPRTDPKKMT